MLAILVLAQVASATPAPTPAALASASTAVSAKPRTLADVARERKLGKKGVTGGTFSVSGTSGTLAVPAGGDSGVSAARTSDGYSRVRNAEADVQSARRAVDDAAVKTGMTSLDAEAARAKLDAARRELNKAREDAARASR